MPATDFSSASFGRSILSLRRDHHASMDSSPTGGLHHHHYSHSSPTCPFPSYEADLESFQRQIIDRFSELSAGKDPESPVLSLNWIRSLLHAFRCCQEEFRVILIKARSLSQKPPLDRLVQDFFDRSVKALDVCNAIRDGIEQIREWRKLLEIVLVALDSDSTSGDGSNRGGGVRVLGEGQFRRAKKALIDLSISMLDEKDSNSVAAALAHRNRSFGRHNAGSSGTGTGSRLGHFRSLSWSVSRSWSASRQLQAIGNNLTPPRANEVAVTGGVAGVVYAMGSVLLLVMWALVAAIPCQDRGLHMHFSVPRGIPWAGAVMGVHERVLEESRRKERRNACGLLREISQMEKCARGMLELVDSVQFPLSEDKEREVREQVAELRKVYDGLKDGLDPLERQVREVFHRIVISRTEGLDSIGRLGQ